MSFTVRLEVDCSIGDTQQSRCTLLNSFEGNNSIFVYTSEYDQLERINPYFYEFHFGKLVRKSVASNDATGSSNMLINIFCSTQFESFP